MNEVLEKYPYTIDKVKMKAEIEAAKALSISYKQDVDKLKLLFSCIDLTSLNTIDSSETVRDFVMKVNEFSDYFPNMPHVAALCVYPVFSSVLKSALRVKGIHSAVVSGGFPSSQTYSDVKKLETERAIQFGANEVDIVISVGEFLEGNYEFVGREIRMIKDVLGDIHLKVILETGVLNDPEEIWTASMVAMDHGADFIKTSTGKEDPAATLEAAYVMLQAIKTFENTSKNKIGFKPAGGIATSEDAFAYLALVESILGEEWLNNTLFRVGASRLANNILSDVNEAELGYKKEVKYF